MRTKLFGPLLGLSLLSLSTGLGAGLSGCSDIFSGYLRDPEISDASVPPDGPPPVPLEDLAGADLTGLDLTSPPDLTTPVCTRMAGNLATLPGNTNWFRVAVGDFNGDGRDDFALAGAEGTTVRMAFLLQQDSCAFSSLQIPSSYTSATALTGVDIKFDFAAFRRPGGQWNTVAVGPETQGQWCSFNGMDMACVQTNSLANLLNAEKKLVADTRGRTVSDQVLVHMKDTTNGDKLLRLVLNGAAINTNVLALGVEPAFATATRHDNDMTAIGVSNFATPNSFLGIRAFNGTTYVPANGFTSLNLGNGMANGNPLAYEMYLYGGRFSRSGADSFDDLVAIQKNLANGTLTARSMDVGSATMAAPVTWSPSGTTHRDLVFVRDVNSDAIDELIVSRQLGTASSRYEIYASQANGTFASQGGERSLGASIVTALTVNTLGPEPMATRPWLITVVKNTSDSTLRIAAIP